MESSFKTSYPLSEQNHLWWQSQVSIIFHQSNPIDPMLEMQWTLPGNPSWHAARHPWNSKAFRVMWVGSNLGSLQWGFKNQWLLNSVQTIMLIIFLSFWYAFKLRWGRKTAQILFQFWDMGYGHSFELVDTNQKPLCKIVTTRMIPCEFSLCVFPAHCHITMSVVTICTGCWLVGELLLVFFYKASQPPQSSKSKQWYPFFRGAFEMRTRHRCLAWESITAELTAIKLWCPRGSVLITSEPCENPQQSYRFMWWVPQFNGSVPVRRTDHGLHGDKHDIKLQKDCNAT